MPKSDSRLRRLAESLGCTWVRNAKHGAIFRTPTGGTVLVACSPKDADSAADNLRKQIAKSTPKTAKVTP